MQPGETITPGSPQPQPPTPAPEPPVSAQPQEPTPEPPQQPVPPPQEEAQPTQAAPQESAGWAFTGSTADDAPVTLPPSHPVNWTASEYASHDKPAGWYMMLVVTAIAIAAIIYFITRDIVSPIVIIVVGIAFAAFGARKPQVLQYAVDNTGVHIGQKTYAYGQFRTFSVIEEGAVRSILLMPMQRFNLPISIYYDPQDEDKIVEALGTHLPHEDRQAAPIDNFMRKIRF